MSLPLKRLAFFSVVAFSIVSILLLIQHEMHSVLHTAEDVSSKSHKLSGFKVKNNLNADNANNNVGSNGNFVNEIPSSSNSGGNRKQFPDSFKPHVPSKVAPNPPLTPKVPVSPPISTTTTSSTSSTVNSNLNHAPPGHHDARTQDKNSNSKPPPNSKNNNNINHHQLHEPAHSLVVEQQKPPKSHPPALDTAAANSNNHNDKGQSKNKGGDAHLKKVLPPPSHDDKGDDDKAIEHEIMEREHEMKLNAHNPHKLVDHEKHDPSKDKQHPQHQPPNHPIAPSTESKHAEQSVAIEVEEVPIPMLSKETRTDHRGHLMCDGKETESEVIYWKEVSGDTEFESPITPHHGVHDDRYITFEYDQGGWNNVRMSMECVLVMAHAMGRTLVIPPQQHLYLLGKQHKDKEDTKAHDEMGFQDFFDLDLLKSQKGFHMMTMKDFLTKEAVTGGLKGIKPPNNDVELWGGKLWGYLKKAADENPEWMGKFVAFPDQPGDFNVSTAYLKTVSAHSLLYRKHLTLQENQKKTVEYRLQEFGGERTPVFYDSKLQKAHHIHFPADGMHRILQHHYAYTFFADPEVQSFYKRFIRDYMRYKDNIQCAGHDLLQYVREDARKSVPNNPDGTFYAMHVRRGDLQFKDVKIGAPEMVKNLKFPNGTSIIPAGALVYLSTDDPDGLCLGCYVNRQPCESYEKGKKPVGCPEDTSWNAFVEAGWKVRILRNYTSIGALKDVNPNLLGMVESIVCSKAITFAGTYYSTFTGYIHRLRGFHGLGESTYYHSTGKVFQLQSERSVGHGWVREWRGGWTDDGGELI